MSYKIVKRDAQLEKDLQEIEDLMIKKGISIEIISERMILTYKRNPDFHGVIVDTESTNYQTYGTSLPRTFDTERIAIANPNECFPAQTDEEEPTKPIETLGL